MLLAMHLASFMVRTCAMSASALGARILEQSSKRSLFPRRLTIIPAAPIASAPIRVISVGIASIGTVVGPIAEPAVTGPGITAPAGFCRVGGKSDKGDRERSHCYDQSRMLAH